MEPRTHSCEVQKDMHIGTFKQADEVKCTYVTYVYPENCIEQFLGKHLRYTCRVSCKK
jgi:hypothetical protein